MAETPNNSAPFATNSEAAEAFSVAEAPATPTDQSVSWTASEFIAHEKSAMWYVAVCLGGLFAGGILYLLTKDIFIWIVLFLAACVLAVYGARQPRQLAYAVTLTGVQIAEKFYPFTEYRSFSVIPEGAFSSIVFMPLKRFGVPLTIYYAPETEDEILAILSNQLPFEHREMDAVDRLMKKIRF